MATRRNSKRHTCGTNDVPRPEVKHHWIYPHEFSIDDWFGFIYRIIDTTTDTHYIGKKQFWKTNRKTVAGRKNKKIVRKESDWKTYTSSSSHVNDKIAAIGKDKFVFLIESLHKSKASLHYAEVERQVFEDVLRAKKPDGSPKYYNRLIGNIKFIPPELTDDEKNHRVVNHVVHFSFSR